MNKTVKMFNDNFEQVLTDLPNLTFLDFEEEDVAVQTNTLEVKGRDGVLVGSNTFGPFKLILNFVYEGVDTEDYHLFKQRMRGLLFRREPFILRIQICQVKNTLCTAKITLSKMCTTETVNSRFLLMYIKAIANL
ncbi:hypothetical protein P6439_05075 [Staphylococcus arlettae]|nr:hypothetical protein [Staphylococcus arlettae]